MQNRRVSQGILLVALGAALWGTDAIFRRGLAIELPATTLVFLEHLVLVAITAPVLWRARSELTRLNRVDWLAALVVGAGSSALATVMFTASFRYGDPTTPLLLQKVQPLVAVAAARLLLGERLVPRYAWFLLSGLAGAYLVAFSDPTTVSISALTPAMLAVGAAILWGLGTVLGRHLTSKLSFSTVTALRFAIALPALALVVGMGSADTGLLAIDGNDVLAVVLLALVPGLAALTLYYRGLRSTPASAATLAELSFPLSAIGLNYLVFGTAVSSTQWLGVALLAATITTMTWLSHRGKETAIGIRLDQPVLSKS
ncbi:MAG: DMT family transporter [Actinobacteria bacterium]|nr:MAG: DMT family transporter [Actinomycetota bacterium]